MRNEKRPTRNHPKEMAKKNRKKSNKIIRLDEVSQFLEALAPSSFAEPYDHPGLLCGEPGQRISKAYVANDLTEELLDTARRDGAQLIVVHHPPLFPGPGGHGNYGNQGAKGLFHLVHDKKASLFVQAAFHKIAIYALHTQFDRADRTACEKVAFHLGVKPEGRLTTGSSAEALLKLVVFVPETHIQKVQDGLYATGIGQIGRYDSCGFVSQGKGTFRGNASTLPFLGKPGVAESVSEGRLETVLPRFLKEQAIKALRATHPYEEIAYDFYPLDLPIPRVSSGPFGIGFFGNFKQVISFPDLAKRVKRAFAVRAFRITGKTRGRFQRVAFSPGSGKGLLRSVIASGAQVFVTGELDYHQALEAQRAGITVIEVGHVESEVFFQTVVRNWLTELPISVKEWSRREQLSV